MFEEVRAEREAIKDAFKSWPRELTEWFNTHEDDSKVRHITVYVSMVRRDYESHKDATLYRKTLLKAVKDLKKWWEAKERE